ncbi:hypothetical protein [Phocaeicola vulgatus]
MWHQMLLDRTYKAITAPVSAYIFAISVRF